MKNEEVKYPNSANLFKFCRLILDQRYGGVRVIDQDIGQILGFDPADCSHWKKGKKNVRSIHAMKNIAKHLGVDERLIVEVAAGEIDEGEAFCEFKGYGATSIDPKVIENAKKEFYRKNAKKWSKDKEQEFKNCFTTDEAKIDSVVQEIHQKMNLSEAPLYLPEIAANFPEIQLKPTDDNTLDALHPVRVLKEGSHLSIFYQAGTEMKPYVRYHMCKGMAGYFLSHRGFSDPDLKELSSYAEDVESNIFASKILAPSYLIKKEIKQVQIGKDIVSQLAEIFWVSKVFINRRIQEVLQNL